MRETKFRAWDKVLEKMLVVGVLDFDEWFLRTSISGGIVGERHSFKNEETDRFILIQYTGLLDKNGKEIYEGDILAMPNHQPCFVEYSEDCGAFQLKLKREWKGKMAVWTYAEDARIGVVIGNIYEHPKLLEA